MFKQSFSVYKRGFGTFLSLMMSACVGVIVTIIGGGLIQSYMLYNNIELSLDVQIYLLTAVGALIGAAVFWTIFVAFVKSDLKTHAKMSFDEAVSVKGGLYFAVKEAYKDLVASGELHSGKINLLFAQANNAATHATYADMDVRDVQKAFSGILSEVRKSNGVPEETLKITIGVSSYGFNVSIRLDGKYLFNLRYPELPETES